MTSQDGRDAAAEYTHFQDLRDEAIGQHGDRWTAAHLAANEWYHQRVALSRGAEFRDDAPTPDSVYEGYSHQQLHRMVTEGLSGAQIGEVSYAWSELANALSEFSERLHDQARRTDAVWQGGAAESAKAYVKNMGDWSEELGRCAQLVSHQVSMQCEAARNAHGAMPEPQPYDVRTEIESWPATPDSLSAVAPMAFQRQQSGRDRKNEAVRVMNDYDQALRNAAERQPVFPSPPRLVYAATRDTPTGSPAAGRNAPADLGTTTVSSSQGAAGDVPVDGHRAGAPPGSGTGSGIGAGTADRPGTPVVGAVPTPSPTPGQATGIAPAGATPRGAAPPLLGMPGAPGARGQGTDDEEHQNKYRVEGDEGDWFHGMERPVQPVLGADPNPADNE